MNTRAASNTVNDLEIARAVQEEMDADSASELRRIEAERLALAAAPQASDPDSGTVGREKLWGSKRLMRFAQHVGLADANGGVPSPPRPAFRLSRSPIRGQPLDLKRGVSFAETYGEEEGPSAPPLPVAAHSPGWAASAPAQGRPLGSGGGVVSPFETAAAMGVAGAGEGQHGGGLDAWLVGGAADDPLPDLLVEGPLDRNLSNALLRAPSLRVQPRTNPPAELAVTWSGGSRERLLERLDEYGLTERVVCGDGNCQFSSLSDQLYRNPGYHAEVRRRVVHQLRSHADLYRGFVPDDYDDYVARMARLGTWGDHVTLQAAADAYVVGIRLITSFRTHGVITVDPVQPPRGDTSRMLFLSFFAEFHYNSIYPKGELPVACT